jgi:hypothetical protein
VFRLDGCKQVFSRCCLLYYASVSGLAVYLRYNSYIILANNKQECYIELMKNILLTFCWIFIEFKNIKNTALSWKIIKRITNIKNSSRAEHKATRKSAIRLTAGKDVSGYVQIIENLFLVYKFWRDDTALMNLGGRLRKSLLRK